MLTFKERLYNGPTLVGDAAKKPRLLEYVNQRLDVNQLNLTNPAAVLAVHKSDLEAGADVIMTNTWDVAHLVQRLGDYQVFALSKKGVEIARQAAGSRAYVVPVMGPVAWNKREFEEIGSELTERLYSVPLSAFREAQPDGLVLETFTFGPDILLAYKTARKILGDEIPIIALFGMVQNGSTPSMSGIRPIIRYFRMLKKGGADYRGADSVGIGCTHYEEALKAQERVAGEVEPPLTVSVNITKEIWRGQELKTVSPRELGRLVGLYEGNNATFIFPCCGGNPLYIREIKAQVNPLPRNLTSPRSQPELKYKREISEFERALMKGEKVLCIEPRAPQQVAYAKTPPPYRIIDAFLAAGQKVFVNITDLAGGVPAINPVVLGYDIENEPRFKAQGLEAIVHIACSEATPDKNEQEMRTALWKRMKNILVLGGDTSYGSGTSEYASSVLEVLASQCRPKLFSGVSLDMSGDEAAFGNQLRLLKDKVDLCLGRQDLERYPDNQTIVPVFTQVIYDPKSLEARYRILKEKFGEEAKVIVGVYPLLSLTEANKFMKKNGVKIPKHVLERYSNKPLEEQRRIGIEIAREIVETAKGLASGVYLIQPAEASEKAAQTMLEILGVS